MKSNWQTFIYRRQAFLFEGERMPVLTKEEEVTLATIIHDEKVAFHHRETARQIMILSNVRLVTTVAKKYRNFGLPMEDLVQWGTVGLVRAVDKFDHSKGYKFSTYAPWWIRQTIRDALDKTRLIYVPQQKIDQILKIRRIMEKYPNYTPIELAGELGVSVAKVIELLEIDQLEPIQLSQPAKVTDLVEKDTLGDIITNPDRPEDGVLQASARSTLESVLSLLPPQERSVLVLQSGYGDDVERCYTDREISQILGVSLIEVIQISKGIQERFSKEPFLPLLEKIKST